MTSTTPTLPASWASPRWMAALGALALALAIGPLQAAPPEEKGGGKGGGSSGGSGPVAEQHFKWRVPLKGPYSAVRPVVGAGGTVYVVDVHDHLFAVSPDGHVMWEATNAGSKGLDIGPDGTIYTGNENHIKAFRPDGTLKWTFVQEPRAFVLIDVAVGPDGHVYAVASSGMGVFSLADMGSSAQLRWTNREVYARTFVGYTEIEFGPTTDGLDRQLYFYANGHTRAVRLSDGASIFTVGGGNTPPRVSAVDGTWHRPASAHAPDASLVWSFQFPLATGTTEPSLGRNGMHYAVNSGYVLYAIRPWGAEAWHTALDEFVGLPDVDPRESTVMIAAGGTATHPAALKAVNAANGNALWRVEFPPDGSGRDQFVDSRVAFSANGDMAYVTTAIAVSGVSYLNAIDMNPALPSASTVLRSTAIELNTKSGRKSVGVTGNVTVMDENLGRISGATVSATWTLPDGTTRSQVTTTSGTGVAKFSLSGEGGRYQLTVSGIAKSGYQFDPQHSVLEAVRFWY